MINANYYISSITDVWRGSIFIISFRADAIGTKTLLECGRIHKFNKLYTGISCRNLC